MGNSRVYWSQSDYKGERAMLTSSSAAYGDIARNARFEFAISPLPYHGDVKGAPQNTLIGGASLWAVTAKPKTANSKGIRLRHFVQIRAIVDEELEAVRNQSKPPERTLEDAVGRGNQMLRQ